MALELHYAPWQRPLHRPLQVGTAAGQVARSGLLVGLGSAGRWGFGDAAPLPGWSRETLDEVTTTLRTLARELTPSSLEAHLPALPPSLAWALASAAAELASPAEQAEVASAVLVEATDEAHVAAILDQLAPRGTATLKLKVGRRGLDEECAAVRAVATAGHRLRLDGNRRCSVAAALALAEAAGAALEFFEEPVASALLPELPRTLPLALDETLDETLDEVLDEALSGRTATAGQALDALAEISVAWVLKPTMLGPARCQAALDAAAGRGLRVIVSSAFESRIGRRALVLAAARWAPETTHGLGTGPAFAADISSTRPLLVEDAARCRALAATDRSLDQIDVAWERLA